MLECTIRLDCCSVLYFEHKAEANRPERMSKGKYNSLKTSTLGHGGMQLTKSCLIAILLDH